MPRIVKANEAARYYNVSMSNLRKWAREGRVQAHRTAGGQFQYVLPSIDGEGERVPTDGWTSNILYARVSSRKQQEDLERQALQLQQLYPDFTLVKDIGSGINYQRKGFQAILERLFQGSVTRVVVAYQDRFTRFGFDFFQWLFQKFGATLESVEQPNTDNGQDLVADIMEVFTVFTARYYGRRKYNRISQENSDAEDEILPDNKPESHVS